MSNANKKVPSRIGGQRTGDTSAGLFSGRDAQVTSPQKPGDREVFIQLRPVDSSAAADQSIIRASRGRCVSKSREPGERNRELASVSEANSQGIVGAANIDCSRLRADR
jgi:hypothetical protein